ncbi:hypothetical protein VNO77_14948 [Canavalia gladiata]|uniref:Uncharacterized protein n=1 Tax=Canavalia gladiata TaxID=3824 RepID=A0AAN9QVM4_CANGL
MVLTLNQYAFEMLTLVLYPKPYLLHEHVQGLRISSHPPWQIQQVLHKWPPLSLGSIRYSLDSWKRGRWKLQQSESLSTICKFQSSKKELKQSSVALGGTSDGRPRLTYPPEKRPCIARNPRVQITLINEETCDGIVIILEISVTAAQPNRK